MKDFVLSKLAEITEEEQIFFDGGDTLKKIVYSRSSRFHVEKERVCRSNICYGSEASAINMKTHIRMTDFPPHSHDYIEIMYVCQGQLTTVIDNEELTLLPGDIIILGKDAIHSTKKASLEDIVVVLLISCDFFASICNKLLSKALISDKMFAQFTASGASTYCLFHTQKITEIDNIMENIVSSFIFHKDKSIDIAQLEFHLMMSYLAGLPDARSELYKGGSKTDKALRKFNNYIETSYTTATLSRAAEILGFTPTYTCRWIARHYSMTFNELLQEKRFSVALELLSESSLSINQIIHAVGYENTSYFYKEFNKRFEITPMEIRKSSKQK